MLVLSRKEGERIVIGDNVTLVISKVSGNRVTIGIEAPRDVKVVRGELKEVEVELEPAALSAVMSTGMPGGASRVMESRPVALREFAAAVLPLQRQVG